MSIKHILIDFDGTLGYRDGMWVSTLHSILEKNGYTDISDDMIRSEFHSCLPWHLPETSHKELFQGVLWWDYINESLYKVLLAVGVKKEAARFCSFQFKDEYLLQDKWFLYDDTIEFLEKIKGKGIGCSILSNHVPELTDIVNFLGVKKYFKNIYCSADIGFDKPNKGIYNFAVRDLNINKEDLIMIGDNYTADVFGANQIEIKSILVRKENDHKYEFYSEDLIGAIKIIENQKS